jgi:hypothetical protein
MAGSVWTPRRDHTIFANYGGALTNDTSLPGDYVPVISVRPGVEYSEYHPSLSTYNTERSVRR